MDTDRPGTPVPPVEVPELMDAGSLLGLVWVFSERRDLRLDHRSLTASSEIRLFSASSEPGALDAKPVESPGDPSQLTRKGRKRKTVTWPEEGKLREYFYFELDETERGAVRFRVWVPGVWAQAVSLTLTCPLPPLQ